MKIQNIMIQVYPALGTAIAIYTGQNYGAGEMKRIKKGVNACLAIEAIYSVFVMALSWSVFPMAVRIFAEDPTGELYMIACQMYRRHYKSVSKVYPELCKQKKRKPLKIKVSV